MHTRKVLFAALLACGVVSAQAADTLITNGTVSATIADAGYFASSSPNGLSYLGHEYVNFGTWQSWYALNVDGAVSKAQEVGNTNPLGASIVTPAGSPVVVNAALGGLTFFQTVTTPAANQLAYTVQITNNTGRDIKSLLYGVGIDPDPDQNALLTGSYVTNNTIVGTGNAAAVNATGPISGFGVTLGNTTSASAFKINAYIDGACCTALDPQVGLTAAQPLGFFTNADHSISLSYDLGTLHAGDTVSLGYAYTFAVPEPDTYAMLLAGLGIMGFIARRRMQNVA